MDLQITIEGRTYVAEPRPEDQQTIEQLLSRGEDITLSQADGDTEGHVLAADEIFVDVEGHAMTLRLPAAGDAAALRRALAVGTLTATVAIAGFIAGTQVGAQADPLSAPAAVTVSSGPTGTYAESEKGGQAGSYTVSEKGDNTAPAQPKFGPRSDPGAGNRGPGVE